MCKGQANSNDKKASYVLILGKPASVSFLKSKCVPSKLLVASLHLECDFSITELRLPLCLFFLIAAPVSINYVNFSTDENRFLREGAWGENQNISKHLPCARCSSVHYLI